MGIDIPYWPAPLLGDMGVTMTGMKSSAGGLSMNSKIPARARIEMGRGVSLLFRDPGSGPGDYPICRIQRGLVLAFRNRELVEEGTGFGVPLLRLRHETIFPGRARVTAEEDGDASIVEVDYEMCLVERMAAKSGRSINSQAFYRIKEYLSWLHRKCPPLRGVLTQAASSLRRTCGIETRFENIATAGVASVVYTIRAKEGKVHVGVNLSALNKECTEVIITNEQGANHFDRYCDSSGVNLTGNAIGTWDETCADEASLIDSGHDIAFTLQKVKGARLFRGRELVAGRLAWSGLNYVIPRFTVNFAYAIRIGAAT